GQASSLPPLFDLAKATVNEVVAELASPILMRRMLAMNELTDRFGKEAVAPVEENFRMTTNVFQKVHDLWVLHRLGGLAYKHIRDAAEDRDGLVRAHAMRVIAELDAATPAHRFLATLALKDRDALVARAGADALGRHPAFDSIYPLLALRQRVPAADTHLL